MPPLKKRRLIRAERPKDIRFLTFSCLQRLPLLRGPDARDIVLDALFQARDTGSFQLYAWVIMPSHLHLLIRPNLPEHTVPRVLRQIKEPAARTILKEWRSRDAPILERLVNAKGQAQFWLKGGGYDRNIYSQKELMEKLTYIHQNPVRAGLVSLPTEWKWSSANAHHHPDQTANRPDPVPRL